MGVPGDSAQPAVGPEGRTAVAVTSMRKLDWEGVDDLDSPVVSAASTFQK